MTVEYKASRQCGDKIRYDTKQEAKAEAKRLEKRAGRMVGYRCPHCDMFHVGHKPPSPGDLRRLSRLDETLT